MEKQRHKRKESYSILIVSNLDRKNRQFHIARSVLHCLFFLAFCICVAVGVLSYLFTTSGQQINLLSERLREAEQHAQQSETEKKDLDSKNQELEAKLATVHQELEEEKKKLKEAAAKKPEEPETDPTLPSLYPSSEAGTLTAAFSEEHPYISIAMKRNSNIIAAGEGTISSVSSDDTYLYIIEIEYDSGYKSRYLYGQEAQLKVLEGMEVHGGTTLLTVVSDDTILDYQVIYEGDPINPILIMEAKG